MLSPKKSSTITKAGGKIYVIGKDDPETFLNQLTWKPFDIAGGEEGPTVLDTVESYDEALGKWSSEATIPAKLKNACAVGLPDGRILLSGGSGGTPNGAFLFDPESNEWGPTQSSTFGRADHSCMLYNYKGNISKPQKIDELKTLEKAYLVSQIIQITHTIIFAVYRTNPVSWAFNFASTTNVFSFVSC